MQVEPAGPTPDEVRLRPRSAGSAGCSRWLPGHGATRTQTGSLMNRTRPQVHDDLTAPCYEGSENHSAAAQYLYTTPPVSGRKVTASNEPPSTPLPPSHRRRRVNLHCLGAGARRGRQRSVCSPFSWRPSSRTWMQRGVGAFAVNRGAIGTPHNACPTASRADPPRRKHPTTDCSRLGPSTPQYLTGNNHTHR